MNLYKHFALKLDKGELISIVGAGGKTTIMFHLAKELKSLGKKVLITTSTAIWCPSQEEYDDLYFLNDWKKMDISTISESSITIMGSEISREGKLLGLNKSDIDEIFVSNMFDFILVEADGSKSKSIKAPAEHEPVIPDKTSIVIGVIGLDSLGKSINNEHVHRAEIFSIVTNSNLEECIDENIIYKLITHKNGLFKATPSNSDRYLLLNKVDDKIAEVKASSIRKLLEEAKFDLAGILICSFKIVKIIGVK